MRNQQLPDVEALLPAVVKALATGPADPSELVARVANPTGTDTVRAETKRALQSRVQKSLRCLRMAGLVTISGKRPPELTAKGRGAMETGRKIDFAYLRTSENFQKFEAGLRDRARVGRERALDQLPEQERRRIAAKNPDKSIYATRVTGVIQGGAPGLGKTSK